MTVSYSNDIASTTAMGVFWKLLGRWRGSIYKLIWREVLVFSFVYYIIKLIYVQALDKDSKVLFDAIVKYCRSYSTSIPLSFVLGFYVNLVMDRWWKQYKSLPWPDTLGVQISSLLEGLDERSRMMRRTVMRYVNLSYVLALEIVSCSVNQRFQDLESLVEAGFMEQNEKDIITEMKRKIPPKQSLYWLPLVWASSILTKARKENLIKDEIALKTMLDSITDFRSGLASLMGYNTISIPLVYTQVVTLAVYSFFAGSLMASQYIDSDNSDALERKENMIIPWFTLLQYLFYVGWLKVAETLVNPFGNDDDDFEITALIDRNFAVGYIIVDTMHDKHPDLVQDKYWEQDVPKSIASLENHKDSGCEDQNRRFSIPFMKSGATPYLSRAVRHVLDRKSILKRDNTKVTHDSPQKLLEDDNTTIPEEDVNCIRISVQNDQNNDKTEGEASSLLKGHDRKGFYKDDIPYADDKE